jgi:hypothetical protein
VAAAAVGASPPAKAEVLPGLVALDPAPRYPDSAVTIAYSDHWVSNVHDREGFLEVMKETLGFEAKVDFNAGVVAAGEAMIESTVTGNSPAVTIDDLGQMLTNQQQVYLPTNNALSSAGHVHLFLEQLGQGVQHLASRVPDLVAFIQVPPIRARVPIWSIILSPITNCAPLIEVEAGHRQRANAYRCATGKGLAFLDIPRSYYGRLTPEALDTAHPGIDGEKAMFALVAAQPRLVDAAGAVELSLPEPEELEREVARALAAGGQPAEAAGAVAAMLGGARYSNLFNLLRERLTEDEYLAIVQNQILVDIQAGDVLYQIFTAPVLQARPTSIIVLQS